MNNIYEKITEKYNALYNGIPKLEYNILYYDNIRFVGSGINKRVGIKLENDTIRIENEDFTIDYNGKDFRVYGAYWFKDNFENDTKIKNAILNIYEDMKLLKENM